VRRDSLEEIETLILVPFVSGEPLGDHIVLREPKDGAEQGLFPLWDEARGSDHNRFVTGVSWVDGEMWHGAWESDESDLRRIDPQAGEVLERIELPRGIAVSGPKSNSSDQFLCGGRSEEISQIWIVWRKAVALSRLEPPTASSLPIAKIPLVYQCRLLSPRNWQTR